MTTRTRLADLMAQASPHLPLALSAALQAEHMAVCQTLDEMQELLREARISVSAERAYSDSEPHVKYLSYFLAKIDAALERKP
jgi:hypothetical protein